jgi:hypothetical protein
VLGAWLPAPSNIATWTRDVSKVSPLAGRTLVATFLFHPFTRLRSLPTCATEKCSQSGQVPNAPRNDFEVLQESKSLVQKPNRLGPSRQVPQVLNDSESIDPQELFDFLIVYTGVGAVFRQVSLGNKLAAKQGIFPREGL